MNQNVLILYLFTYIYESLLYDYRWCISYHAKNKRVLYSSIVLTCSIQTILNANEETEKAIRKHRNDRDANT